MRKRPCLLFACIFLTGIVFQRYDWKCLWLVPILFMLLEIYCGVNLCTKKYILYEERDLNVSFYKKGKAYTQKLIFMRRIAGRSAVLLSAFFLGISHMKSEEEFRNTYMSKLEDGSDAIVFGEILTTQETEYGSRLILTDCYVSLKETTIPCNQVMVYVSSDQYRVGQIYQIKGQIHLFECARNEGNFDSAIFYQSQKIDFSIYASEMKLLAYEENALRDAILLFKERLAKVYQNSMEVAAAGFYMGMMIGDKSLLSDRTKELFAVGGISHILAISGLHMSMIGRGFYKFLRKRLMGFLSAGVLAGLILLSYCYMVGSGTSAIRAVGMMLLFFLAQYVGRSYDMLNSLGAVVIYLLWKNSFLIEYSGFQFSVVALIGVGFVGQTLSEGVDRSEVKDNETSHVIQGEKGKSNWGHVLNHISRMRKRLSANLWMSMGITLTTLPIVACSYFEVPLYSPLVNSLVLPILTPVFALAVCGGLIGYVFPSIGQIILIPCGWLYTFYEFVCQFVECLPFGSIITGKPELEIVVLYYVLLFVGCVIIKKLLQIEEEKHNAQKKSVELNEGKVKKASRGHFCITKGLVVKLLLSFTCLFVILCPRKPKSEIIFLDVGQGDAIFIASEDGTTCFIDGGSSDVKEVGDYRILPFLKAHGVKQIDYWFVSHADSDHMSGLLEVMETGYRIRYLVVSDRMPKDENQEKLLSLAEQQQISILQMKIGDSIQTIMPAQKTLFSTEGSRITCLYPSSDATDRNEQSLVLLLEFLDENEASTYKALFSGDISAKGETELIRKGVLEDVNLYKAAHHGSKYSNSKALLDIIQPEICVISCGKDNSYGHPHAEVVESMEDIGVEVIYTMESGQVTFQKDKLQYTKELE